MKKKINKPNYGKDKIQVIISLKRGQVSVIGDNEKELPIARPFKGYAINGIPTANFSEYERKMALMDALSDYRRNNVNASKEKKQELLERVVKNIDPIVYRSLDDYDIKNLNRTHIQEKYVKIMLKPIKRKKKETDKEYKKREEKLRRKWLEEKGIQVHYNLAGLIFNRNTFSDNIYAIKNAIKNRKYATLSIFNKKLSKERNVENNKTQKFKKNSIKKFTASKKSMEKAKTKNRKKEIEYEKNKKYTSKKGLLQELKTKVKSPNFYKKVKKSLVTVGIIGLASLGVWQLNSKPVQVVPHENVTQSSTDKENDFNDSEDKIIEEIKKVDDVNNTQINNLGLDLEDNGKQESEFIQEEKVILNDMLMECLNLGIGSEFTMTKGKYYESPDGEKYGKFGNYENRPGKVTIRYIDAIENGKYYQYNAKDNKTISQIKAEHPNARISYQVNKSDINLGWNGATENDIEEIMVKYALMSVKPYISEDTMKFLCDNDLSSVVDKYECQEYIKDLQNALKQRDKDLSQSQKER